jgi:ADP-heptose:LPS heptosyltransferase
MDQSIEFNDLKVGQRVKVKGSPDEDAVFVALKIGLVAPADDSEIEGLIQSIDHRKNTLRLLNRDFILLDGITVKDSHRNIIGLKDLKVGDSVKLKGKYSGPEGFVPKKIKRQETTGFDLEELQGNIDKIDREKKILNVVGFTVRARNNTVMNDIGVRKLRFSVRRISDFVKYQLPKISHRFVCYFWFSYHLISLKTLKLTQRGKSIVVITLIEHFGDIVACEPVSRYIREKYPQAHIIWCVRGPYRELIENNPHVNEALIVYCLTEWIYLRKTKCFDVIIDLHIRNRICPTCHIPLEKQEGDKRITVENYYEFGNLLASFCQSAGLPVLDFTPQVNIPQLSITRVNQLQLPSEYVVIHCSSNEVDRDWERPKWESLVKRMNQELKINVVEIGSKPYLQYAHTYYTSLCDKLSLLDSAEVIKRSLMFIGIDSGPAHLANAVNTFGIILLGYYRRFKNYLPYSGNYAKGINVKLICEDGPVRNIKVKRVYEIIELYLRSQKVVKSV